MGRFIFISFLAFLFIPLNAQESSPKWQQLALPERGEIWVTPAQGKQAQPVWGHANGMRVGIAPMPGPRGLLRIYTPYLGLAEDRMLNFIAVEPIPEGKSARGFSELEMSDLDNRRGKKFWSSDDSLDYVPGNEEYPARGIISDENGIKSLTVFIFVEPFKNGARVYLRLKFYSNKPYEVEITTYARDDSQKLENCIVTATMGNLARLRILYLADYRKTADELWPDYTAEAFAPHASFSVNDMIRNKKGYYYFIAAPDELNPQAVIYAPGTNRHWQYEGRYATQYWYSYDPHHLLRGLVNGRVVYWASKSPIPGGIAIENFEMKEPFRNGAKFVFGVDPAEPEVFIKNLEF